MLLYEEDDIETVESIVLTKDTDGGQQTFYVMNQTTGEIYYKSVLNYKKDSVVPVIKGIEEDATYEANTREVTVEDANLASVTVNGVAQTFVQGKASFSLTADQETMVYVVVATDCAGNMNDMTVVLNQPASLPVASAKEDPVDSSAPSISPTPDTTGGVTSNGTVTKKVKVVEGAPDTSLTTDTNELKTSVLTDGEQEAVEDGSNANIELRIKNIDSSVSQADKELIIANLGGYTVGEYLDITLWKKVGSSSEKKVTSTNQPIAVTVTVPERLRGGAREFVILRIHNGSVALLEDQDAAANTVTFETDRFSTYVLAYKAGSNRGGGSSSETATGELYLADASPETGDQAPLVPVCITFLVSLSGIILTMIVRRSAMK